MNAADFHENEEDDGDKQEERGQEGEGISSAGRAPDLLFGEGLGRDRVCSILRLKWFARCRSLLSSQSEGRARCREARKHGHPSVAAEREPPICKVRTNRRKTALLIIGTVKSA